MIWGSAALILFVGYEATRLPDMSDLDDHTRPGAVRLIASDGQEVASEGALHGRPVDVSDLPQSLIDALVATEDRRFYAHWGVDMIALARAVSVNLLAGSVRQGGSTLTQQLAKNLFLTPDRSLERKVQELLVAFWLEARFSKDEILTIYLNRVYFGAGAYGVTAAALKYFNQMPEALSLYESAMLVGLLKAPSRYNPGTNDARARARTGRVLLNMVDAGFITRARADSVMRDPPRLTGAAVTGRNHRYFADWAFQRATGYTGPTRSDRTVMTTLDLRLQALAEAAIARHLARDDTGADAGAGTDAMQAAMVVMTPDGAVRAMVGGKSYRESQFNRATLARRQPGSVFKPLIYLAALAQGYRAGDVIEDAPLTIEGWSPRNFDGKFLGPVTLSEALAKSLNVATVRLSERVGRDRTIRLARQFGITAPLGPGPSLALGAGEITLLELTAVYAAFANGGRPVTPHAVVAVSDGAARILYQRPDERAPPAVAPALIADLSAMLERVIHEGTGRRAAIGRRAAGKTGTSQDHRDAWFIGYTDRLIAGIWVGRDDAKPMPGVTGGGPPAEIWADFMRAAHR